MVTIYDADIFPYEYNIKNPIKMKMGANKSWNIERGRT